MTDVELVDVPESAARRWVHASLASGGSCSAAVLDRDPFSLGRFGAIAPRDTLPSSFSDGGVTDARHADIALAEFFARVSSGRRLCLVIEDDVGRKGDPRSATEPGEATFFDDRIVRWLDVDESHGPAAVAAVRAGASGFPLNAFLVSVGAAGLGFRVDAQADPAAGRAIAESLVAIVVGAFDGESFVVWVRDPDPHARPHDP